VRLSLKDIFVSIAGSNVEAFATGGGSACVLGFKLNRPADDVLSASMAMNDRWWSC